MVCGHSQNMVAHGCNSEGGVMKRDLYAEVSARIVAELELGAAPWIKPWSATAGMNTPCNALTNRLEASRRAFERARSFSASMLSQMRFRSWKKRSMC